MGKIIRLTENDLLNLVKRIVSEEDYDAGYESSDEWLDWKSQRDKSLQQQTEFKKHILTSLQNFKHCLEATKQEFIEQNPGLRHANLFSWGDNFAGGDSNLSRGFENLKPSIRLLRTIDETLHLIDQVKIHTLGQGISGLERLSDAAEFLTDHTDGIEGHIIKGISRCFLRFEKSNLLDAKEQYLHYEKEYEDLLKTQPTHWIK